MTDAATPSPSMHEVAHAFYNAVRSIDIPITMEQYPPFHIATTDARQKDTKIAGYLLHNAWEREWDGKNTHHTPLIEDIEERIHDKLDDTIERPYEFRAHYDAVITDLRASEPPGTVDAYLKLIKEKNVYVVQRMLHFLTDNETPVPEVIHRYLDAQNNTGDEGNAGRKKKES